MLWAILNKSWRQHPTRHQLYGHVPPIMKTIQVRRTRHAGHCWRSRDELISDVLLWIPTYGRAKAGWPARTYIQQLCKDTGYSPEDLPEAMNDREEWWERVKDICAGGTIWWWWWQMSWTQVCHYEPESKRQFIEWKMFEAEWSIKKVMLESLGNMKGSITIDFLVKKSLSVNYASYCQLLRENPPYLLNDPDIYDPAMDMLFSLDTPSGLTKKKLIQIAVLHID